MPKFVHDLDELVEPIGSSAVRRFREALEHIDRLAVVRHVRARPPNVFGKQQLVSMVAEHVVEAFPRLGEASRAIAEQREWLFDNGLSGIAQAATGLAQRVQALGVRCRIDTRREAHGALGLVPQESAEFSMRGLRRERRAGRIGEEVGENVAPGGGTRHPLPLDQARVREAVRLDVLADKSRSHHLDDRGFEFPLVARLLKGQVRDLHAHLDVAHGAELAAEVPIRATHGQHD